MGRVSQQTIEKLERFIESLSSEALDRCGLCTQTLTHIVKQAEVATGAGTATVSNMLSERLNESAAPMDRVSGEALNQRVRRIEGLNDDFITNRKNNKQPEESLFVIKPVKDRNFRTLFTGENEWYTPVEYIEAARRVMGGIDCDPATSEFGQSRIKAKEYFTKETDGLKNDWHGRIWLNPPYSQPLIQQFAEKMVEQVQVGNVKEAIILTHNYTDTAWFHLLESITNLICFTRGRIKYEKEDGSVAVPTQGAAFFYIGKNLDAFLNQFLNYGFIR